jgi:hypothetical protein
VAWKESGLVSDKGIAGCFVAGAIQVSQGQASQKRGGWRRMQGWFKKLPHPLNLIEKDTVLGDLQCKLQHMNGRGNLRGYALEAP